MKLWFVFVKNIKEQLRDPLLLSLTIVFAPLFVILYYLWFPSGSTTYTVLMLNLDAGYQTGAGDFFKAGTQVTHAIQSVTYTDGKPLLVVREVENRELAEKMLHNRNGNVLIVIPADFSAQIEAIRTAIKPLPVTVTISGDLTNPYYPVAAILAAGAVENYVQAVTGKTSPLSLLEEPLKGSAARTEFEFYVPGLLVMGSILYIFSAAMTITREVEAGTLRRLKLTHLSALDMLAGTSMGLVLVAIIAVIITFITARMLGFRSQGSLWLAVLICGISSLSTIGIGLWMACYAKNSAQAFVIANFPLTLLMFFSGAIFPVPRLELFTMAGRSFALNDLLPPSHAVLALNKIFTFGAGIRDITYEFTLLSILSLLYLLLGAWFFQRTHLRTA